MTGEATERSREAFLKGSGCELAGTVGDVCATVLHKRRHRIMYRRNRGYRRMGRVRVPLRDWPAVWLLRLLHRWWGYIVIAEIAHHGRRLAVHPWRLLGLCDVLVFFVVWLAHNWREEAKDACLVAGGLAVGVLLADRIALAPKTVEPEEEDAEEDAHDDGGSSDGSFCADRHAADLSWRRSAGRKSCCAPGSAAGRGDCRDC